jgi:hypothetical protein
LGRIVVLVTSLLLGSPDLGRAQTSGATVIQGQYVEEHTLVGCACRPVVWTHDFTLTLSGQNNIHEEWRGHNNRNPNLQGGKQLDFVLGSASGRAAWHVLGPHSLRKFVTFQQHTLSLQITIREKACDLDVRFALRPSFDDMYVPVSTPNKWLTSPFRGLYKNHVR